MNGAPKRVLVVGTARFWEKAAPRRARRLGADLADLGLALTTGPLPGVDKAVAEGYCARARQNGMDLPPLFTQIKVPFRLLSWRTFRRVLMRVCVSNESRMVLGCRPPLTHATQPS